ncbi:16S rRNA (guanine(527)-N(7))-methyltransferase RsmG [Caldimonas thermodepolymerans]|uniref:Ribosomal RNA small subunit methyltransferase G n=1 Tax=Caldimonas thermodepolymerans TaxID=215580 RepID=A0A2S5T1P0_9BURK|nr:16S rRNA (guanine(527)-N(7))-methyltransferase RsmG [Caldimonas thermodepolymerans]PPE68808.1 16S rRNA (guanine(527)-N(7))-methyltransferase RsmG [Caldimonas thermodepolymerans]QPC31582.1 16S rRNA (guanine(527)-N(7))-methyltransferase RsmG [Caldimonas thermodepolymerans]RDH95385.1 16S rRNA m(7)G-527 methyltransferase [Caldimonas thermodepolymerans]TCP03163.1 16S rRNA m(7)G-527 methyltransferase [Caldimonas thermodepolymerans]UZG47998.1 16S rRNA (guanine(527)-N(7))-methyltransferase RsmG [Ca
MTDATPLPAGPLAERLRAGAATLGVPLDGQQQQQLLDYLALIAKWNKVYNLTAVREPSEMLTQHLLDCLAVVPPLRRETGGTPFTLLDVGSGAGLPGVVVALAMPQARVVCVDTVAKKALFIQQVAAELRVPNLRAEHARIEALAPQGADVITSRAFASLADFVSLTAAHLAPGGRWMAMKGRPTEDELAQVPDDLEVFHVEQLTVPELDADRCLVWIRPVQTALI